MTHTFLRDCEFRPTISVHPRKKGFGRPVIENRTVRLFFDDSFFADTGCWISHSPHRMQPVSRSPLANISFPDRSQCAHSTTFLMGMLTPSRENRATYGAFGSRFLRCSLSSLSKALISSMRSGFSRAKMRKLFLLAKIHGQHPTRSESRRYSGFGGTLWRLRIAITSSTVHRIMGLHTSTPSSMEYSHSGYFARRAPSYARIPTALTASSSRLRRYF